MSLFRAAVTAVAAALALGTASAAEHWVYFGTYTGKDGSKGIYRSKFDDATGKLSAPELAAEMGSPSFVAIHPTNKFLYAVGEGGDGERLHVVGNEKVPSIRQSPGPRCPEEGQRAARAHPEGEAR